jgi:two-component system sensor histidine kinase KdpD
VRLTPAASHGAPLQDRPCLVAAQWALVHGQPAGSGTATLAGVDATFYPLETDDESLGVIGIRAPHGVSLTSPERRDFIAAVQYHCASAIARLRARDAQRRSELDLEAEQMRASLLSSVSHDLRTPLGTILGSLGALLDREVSLDEPARRSLLGSAHAEAERLHRLVKNLLEMTRITSGRIAIQSDWQLPEEVVGATLARFAHALEDRELRVTAFSDLCRFDPTLIDLALGNLVDNAIKYAPTGPLEVEALPHDDELRLVVRDRGPGLGAADGDRIFEKFYRGEDAAGSGSGLGLAICKAVALAHGGRVWAVNREPGPGAEVGFAIPLIRLETSSLGLALDSPDEAAVDTP